MYLEFSIDQKPTSNDWCTYLPKSGTWLCALWYVPLRYIHFRAHITQFQDCCMHPDLAGVGPQPASTRLRNSVYGVCQDSVCIKINTIARWSSRTLLKSFHVYYQQRVQMEPASGWALLSLTSSFNHHLETYASLGYHWP